MPAVDLRRRRWLVAALLAAVAIVLAPAYLDLRREQDRALSDFSSEQATLAAVSAAGVSALLTGVARDLTIIVAPNDIYKELRHGDAPPEITTRLARAPDGELVSISSAHAPGLRWFAIRNGGQATFALVDIDRLFAPLTAITSTQSSDVAWVVLDDDAHWLALSPARELDMSRLPNLAPLVARLTQRDVGGAVALERPAAAELGLERRLAVAGYATMPAQHWTLAIAVSARRVRDRARLASWRLAATTSLAALFVGLFGLALFAQMRRQQKLAEALRVAEATAELSRNLVRAEKLATVGTLAAGVAHEVGTPLGIISGRAEQLLARADDPETLQKGLRSILAQVDKVSRTIRQLLDFARQRVVEAQLVPVAAACENAAALVEAHYQRAGVKLTVDVAAGTPSVFADPGQLEQVLVNLLINAADACTKGGHVALAAHAADDRVELAVTDDGCGIAAEHLSAVLDPFFTTKKRGQGTGLGLTIVADIVRNHGGVLQIESVVDRGTKMSVMLPTRAAKESPQ